MKHEILKQALASSGGVMAFLGLIWFFAGDNLASVIASSVPVQIEIERRIDARMEQLDRRLADIEGGIEEQVVRIEGGLEQRIIRMAEGFDRTKADLSFRIEELESRVHGMSSNVGKLTAQVKAQNEQLAETNAMLRGFIFSKPIDLQSFGSGGR